MGSTLKRRRSSRKRSRIWVYARSSRIAGFSVASTEPASVLKDWSAGVMGIRQNGLIGGAKKGFQPEEFIGAIWEERRSYGREGRIKQPTPRRVTLSEGRVSKTE